MLIQSKGRQIAILILMGFLGGVIGFWLGGGNIVNKTENSPRLRIETKDKTFSLASEEVDFNLYWQVWKALQNNYYKQPISDLDLFYGSLRGLVSGLDDPYSIFLDPEIAREFNSELSGNFEGIGAEIGIKQEQLTVVAPLPDSPAKKAGLMAGDKILAIDDIDTSFLSLDYAVRLIRGERGTKVTLTVISPKGDAGVHEVDIIRDVIHIKSVDWETINNNLALITLSHFNDDTVGLFRKITDEIINTDVKGVILDLRNNPGGFLDTAVKVAGYWTGDKVVVLEKQANNETINYEAAIIPLLAEFNTVVLVDGGSASASEIVAGALQDYQLATIIGQTTFGKGTVQNLETLSDGSMIKMTVAEWLTPLGHSIEEGGIKPDILEEMTGEDFDNNIDPQLDRAIEYLLSVIN